jgi:hypothetical protein
MSTLEDDLGRTIKWRPASDQVVSILVFVVQKVSTAATQLCCYSIKVAIEIMYISGCGCVPIKLYLYKQTGREDRI